MRSTIPAAIARHRRWFGEARATLALAWPIILGNFTHMAIFATDTAFIGHYAPHALAAAVLANNLLQILMFIGFGLSMASAPMMANALGRGLHAVRDVRRTVRQTVWACWAYAAIATTGLWNGEALLLALGQEPGLAADAGAYLRVIQWMIFPLLAYWVLRFFLLTLGRPRVTLAITTLGIGVNALGNYLLVFGHCGFPELGLVGSGISSLIASLFLCGGLAGFCTVDRRLKRFVILGRFWRADWPRFAEVWRLGLPIGVTSAMEGVLFFGSVFIVGRFGADALAAHAIVMQISGFAFMVPLGLSEAATIRVGLWAGARDREGVTVAGDVALTLAIAAGCVTASLMFALPRLMIAPFLDVDAAETAAVTQLAARFLLVSGLLQIADYIQFVGAGALRGVKDTRAHMAFILVGHMVLAFPTGAALAFWGGLGGLGVWIGFCVGLFCVATLVLRRWRARTRLGLLERCWAMENPPACE